MPTEYTVNVVAVTTPPIIAVDVAAGCGGGAVKEEVFVQPTEPTEDWTDGAWFDTSVIYTTMEEGEVTVAAVEPAGPWEIFADTSTVVPVAADLVNGLLDRIAELEQRLHLLESRI